MLHREHVHCHRHCVQRRLVQGVRRQRPAVLHRERLQQRRPDLLGRQLHRLAASRASHAAVGPAATRALTAPPAAARPAAARTSPAAGDSSDLRRQLVVQTEPAAAVATGRPCCGGVGGTCSTGTGAEPAGRAGAAVGSTPLLYRLHRLHGQRDRLLGGTCAACGAKSEPCCTSSTCGANLTCSSGTCGCGAAGQLCCNGSSCNTGLYCNGVCAALQANGTHCTANNQCTTGHCTDGVCCGSSDCGPCMQCSTGSEPARSRASVSTTRPMAARVTNLAPRPDLYEGLRRGGELPGGGHRYHLRPNDLHE